MRKLLFMMLLSILLNSCFIFRAHDSSEDAPSYLELQGVYYSDDPQSMATLILASHTSFNENHNTGRYGRYILILRDSTGEKNYDGNWDYLPAPPKGGDYSYGESTCGLLFLPFSKKSESLIRSLGFAHFELIGKQKRLIISCQRGEVATPKQLSFRFQRRAYPVRY